MKSARRTEETENNWPFPTHPVEFELNGLGLFAISRYDVSFEFSYATICEQALLVPTENTLWLSPASFLKIK